MSETDAKTPHQRYVERGFCPAIYWTKAWCNYKAGHSGMHWAKGYGRPGVYWKDEK